MRILNDLKNINIADCNNVKPSISSTYIVTLRFVAKEQSIQMRSSLSIRAVITGIYLGLRELFQT